MTVGTRMGPRTVCTALSWARIGSVTHSSQVTGRMWFSPSISSAVAALDAIMQKASCGVRTWIACQLRFNTSTIDLFRISFIIPEFHGCLFFVEIGGHLNRLHLQTIEIRLI